MKPRTKSEEWFATAQRYLVGGVNSPVRAFRAVGGTPFFVERAGGCRVWDVDGNEYIDYVLTWGPAILGHAHPRVVREVREAADRGTSFGIPHPGEVRLAELICRSVPSIEKVRLCNSGTEACMTAVRLARGFTGRDKIIKFAGCYHGHVDSLLVKAGSGALTFGHPDSAGIPQDFARHTIVLPYNETEPVRAAFAGHPGGIAAVILEPVAGNAGLFVPRPGWLEFLREITAREGALLIFDEVMTGFRVAPGGAQQRYGIRPDLTTLGKVIGGGLPVGAIGGRREIMDCLAPVGPVYQAGTLSGNPLATAAGLATLKELGVATHPPDGNPVYRRLEELGQRLEEGLREAARAAGVPLTINRCGSMFGLYFTDRPVWNLDDALQSDRERFRRFFHGMLEAGVYLAPSPFEAGFLSTAHTEAEVEATVRAAAEVLRRV
ncbi:glutamate-1-semialdehyde 2,1-aminomutase [Limisphaera ngatamarikiensis]|uniref:Glutamate-1-semialdehyde 2,1-aminomutase n=1 Tax=Limisphaera ngatamarikiensis TaxID=1324935 RepID=A0A6M1RZA5_9BACT|nr:glutamate-1-semialdehyde 2,1-aminomutase [Limisphaera ngatamarikiensis]NGO38480.1 glutamate-1-semialdehyde 2,1-aminomutase [Limisphaera ngatamarikiensis]